jgi:hypothetical protein
VYAIPARLSNTADLAAIQNIPDSRTGNIPVFLKVYVGQCAMHCVPRHISPSDVLNGF